MLLTYRRACCPRCGQLSWRARWNARPRCIWLWRPHTRSTTRSHPRSNMGSRPGPRSKGAASPPYMFWKVDGNNYVMDVFIKWLLRILLQNVFPHSISRYFFQITIGAKWSHNFSLINQRLRYVVCQYFVNRHIV